MENKSRNIKPMKKFLIWAGFILLIVLSCFIYWKYYFTYSEGFRAGSASEIFVPGKHFQNL